MVKTLIDTDMFSEILKGRNQSVLNRARTYLESAGEYTISVITVIEIVKGFHKVGREEQVRRFLEHCSHLEVVTIDVAVAEIAGRMYADLDKCWPNSRKSGSDYCRDSGCQEHDPRHWQHGSLSPNTRSRV